MVKQGVAKRAPASAKRSQRPPVTVKHIQALVSTLDSNNSCDLAIKTAACVAFWGVMRLGEVLVAKPSEFNPERNATKAAEISSQKTKAGIPFVQMKIPLPRTTKADGAEVVLNIRPDDPTCPVNALRKHLGMNGRGRSDLPLFAFQSSNNSDYATLSKDHLMWRCNQVWERAGLESLKGHSFRMDGAAAARPSPISGTEDGPMEVGRVSR